MNWILNLSEAAAFDERQIGGKARTLATLSARGIPVPPALCLTVEAYRRFVRQTGLRQRIVMELGRKDPSDMRWEELWDAALRIRNLFLTFPWPDGMAQWLTREIEDQLGAGAFAVRSSAPGEDSAEASFAGLHESFVNVQGMAGLLDAVRKVWASLWSDRALLYRRELKLDVRHSAMAVLIQKLVCGEKSGVAFSQSPMDPEVLLVESVWGLNQGLVDGTIEPDHWELQRQDLSLRSHRPALREQLLEPQEGRVAVADLPLWQRQKAPLDSDELRRVARLALDLEQFFAAPQDLEWTFADSALWLLQSRPVTARRQAEAGDERGWYLSLRRSLDNLKALRLRLEQEVLPGMEAAAAALARSNPALLDEAGLAEEIVRRRGVLAHWEEIYRTECIPMAHGVRLFGEFYNDALRPADPFAFVELLRQPDMRALQRNRRLQDLAAEIKAAGEAATAATATGGLQQRLAELARETGLERGLLATLLARMAEPAQPPSLDPSSATAVVPPAQQEADYLACFSAEERPRAAEMLAIGRASYRLRDDDNLSLDEIRRQLQAAEEEGRRRLERTADPRLETLLRAAASAPQQARQAGAEVRVRQLQGQPAGPGLVTARARVFAAAADLAAFEPGEILVCDAIDPAMTFIVPLASGIVERRGGMLIHGAIIAREYGLPCVTGISRATEIIRTGDRVTVDGYFGLIVIHRD